VSEVLDALTPRYVQVAVPVPLRRLFTYRVPSALSARVEPGARVAVTFGKRKLAGFVVSEAAAPADTARIKPLVAVLDAQPLFARELFQFLVSAADYYLHPLGEVLRAAAPALAAQSISELRDDGFLEARETLPGRRVAMRKVAYVRALVSALPAQLGASQARVLARVLECGELALGELRSQAKSPRAVVRALAAKQLVSLEEREVPSDRFFADAIERDQPPTPNPAQAAAIAALIARLGQGGGFLLHGITGSGKTEVYLRVIAEARARGLGALMLVPEIALTPQLVSRFRARFGDELAVLHSELGERERDSAWHALRSGQVNLAIGARSALFAPIARLGVIIVDEEHDGSFKQEEGFRYHARDMALLRAHRAAAVCVLGSATPSLESYQLAQNERLQYLTLPERATAQALPPIQLVDLTRERGGPTSAYYLSSPLVAALRESLARKEQAILFLNRRGFAPSMRCEGCSELLECPACSVTLTKHRRAQQLRCHYCDFCMPADSACPSCGSRALTELGLGTERLEAELSAVFPEARVARLDRDTAAADGVGIAMDKLKRGEIDIMVGTQMVTKGHDIPSVTVVGVILADQSLGFPDFRAPERTFQLLTQVAGRAGRGERPGKVFFQTFQVQHPAIVRAQTHDYLGFCRDELRDRREHGFPPFARLAAVRVDAGSEDQARRVADELAALAKKQPAVRDRSVDVLGPAPAPIERLRGRYRFRFILRAKERAALRSVASVLARRIDEGVNPARVSIDIDPVSML
jgi:primosomal protein N' (replication factor Y) (superfamily II helicase)